MDLCPATFKSFVVQWLLKIAGCWPQLKPLVNSQFCSDKISFLIILAVLKMFL